MNPGSFASRSATPAFNPRRAPRLPALALRGGLVTAALGALVAISTLPACGKDESLFDPSDPANRDGGGTGFDPNGDGGGGGGGDGGGPGACASTTAAAALTPVNLVVMFDQSGSMGDTTEDPTYDPAQRWIPVGAAMKAFFTDPSSAGMNASLSFFAVATNSCAVADYAAAEVPIRALPSATFSQVLDAHTPKGDTPTRSAVTGAILQGQALLQARPNEKTVIVLVTDGEPFGCGVTNQNEAAQEVQRVVADVAAVKATLPTYVIGVGPSVAALDAVATAGGTTGFHVQVGTPTQTTQQLLAAMGQIRGSVAQCDFDIPAPPDGRALDLDKVNVEIAPPGKAPSTVAYSKDCAGPGWRFDDPVSPKKVQLCPATCADVRATAGGKVNVVFACVARPDVVR